PALRLPAGDGDLGCDGRVADRGVRRRLPATNREVEGDRHGPRHRPHRAGHAVGAGAMSTTLLVIAKAPVPGRVKTRLTPPFSPVEAAALAEAALCDTLDVVCATPAARRVLALEGEPGPWLPPGMEVVRQR